MAGLYHAMPEGEKRILSRYLEFKSFPLGLEDSLVWDWDRSQTRLLTLGSHGADSLHDSLHLWKAC